MKKKNKEILSRFIAEEETSNQDLSHLQRWLSDSKDVEKLFFEEWEKVDEKECDITFADVKEGIAHQKNKVKTIPLLKRVLINYQKVAAILLVPIVTVFVFFLINQFETEPTWFNTTAELGQKSKVALPDGTKIWLNSGSEISYPDNFGKSNRSVQLSGEAYFEVKSNPKKPFFVEAGSAKIKVLGTTFNLKAYPDENEIETTLIEGKVELTIAPEVQNIAARTVELKPGESLVFNKIKNELKYGQFESEEILAWTNNQLIFRNDNFENLVRKIERWYDVEIVYDESSLNDQRLTVELYQGELLFRLLDIIELAMDVECISEKDKIYIKSKK